MRIVWIVLTVYGLLGFRGPADASDDAVVLAPKDKVRELPAGTQLLASVSFPTNRGISSLNIALAEWPSPELIVKLNATRDRTNDYPTIYRNNNPRDKPKQEGADTREDACYDAGKWIAEVLQGRWVPDDLDKRLILLQRDPPSLSAIICRYEIKGNVIQIQQRRATMWLVIKPVASKVSAADDLKFILHSIDTFLVGAEEINETKVDMKVPGPKPEWQSGKWTGYSLERSWIEERQGDWRQSYRVFSDGSTVAFFLIKNNYMPQRPTLADSDIPWF
jgi:hypothetical protein